MPKVPEGEAGRHADYGHKYHWNKQSIFWDLPYWRTNLIRHNLDVMHIEKNVKRRELELVDLGNGKFKKPKAPYTLSASQRRAVCEWVSQLKLPDGYVSNIRKCVDLNTCKLQGMKSHDSHIFMERLLPTAFSSLPGYTMKLQGMNS